MTAWVFLGLAVVSGIYSLLCTQPIQRFITEELSKPVEGFFQSLMGMVHFCSVLSVAR